MADNLDGSASGQQDREPRSLDGLPLTRLHLGLLLVLSAGLMFDTLEATMTSVLATVFAHSDAMTRGQLSAVLGAMFVGGAIGAPLGGRLGDRIGRRKALILALVGYAAMSLFAAFSTGVPQLVVARFLGGMALAAYPPVMWTYLADVSPPASRGRMIMLSSVLGGAGATLAPLSTRLLEGGVLFGLEGWRGAFAIGGLGGLFVAALTILLPESPRWLDRVGLTEQARLANAHFLASAPLRRARIPAPLTRAPWPVEPALVMGPLAPRLALLLVLQLLQPVAVIGFLVLSGVVLKHKGFSLQESLLYGGLAAIGSPIGALLGAIVVDRLSRPFSFIACALVLAISGLGFAYASTAAPAIGFALIFMLVGTIYTSVLGAYGSEMFVTHIRGLTSGFGYGANRIGAALVPFGLLPLLLVIGPVPLFDVIGATLLLSALLVWVWGPRGTTGRSLS